jgi:putative Ca2+/H+ antiporter (TMEM165/GDT1 family)
VGKTFDRHRPSMPGRSTPLLRAADPEDRVEAFVVSFGVIFVAELGDKSQLMALTFSTRYRPLPILVGIAIATAFVHAFSVILGAVVGASLPTHAISIVAGIAFFGFAAWTLRGDTLDDEEATRAQRTTRSAVVAAAGVRRLRRAAPVEGLS